MLRVFRQRLFQDEATGEWILNGSKCFITNGKVADVYIIIAYHRCYQKTREAERVKKFSAFIVEKGTPGFSFGNKREENGYPWFIHI